MSSNIQKVMKTPGRNKSAIYPNIIKRGILFPFFLMIMVFFLMDCSYISYKIGKNLSKSKITTKAGKYNDGEKLRIILKDDKVYSGYFDSDRSLQDSLCLVLEDELKCVFGEEIDDVIRINPVEKNVGLMIGIGIDFFIIFYSIIAWWALAHQS